MCYKLSQNEMGKIQNLFAHSQEKLVWSCLQGLMGTAYANHAQKPTSAQIIIGSFSFFAGEADRRLVANLPETLPSGYMLMIPENEAWSALIEEQYGGKAERFLRYAIKKEPEMCIRDRGRAEYVPVTDDEAVEAFEYLSKTEGIIPAIESAHAVAYAKELANTMAPDELIVINISGRGDKDVAAIAR